ncbi:hypothetical protein CAUPRSCDRAFT_12079, partial [Caulochytrium protostelioides]
MRPTTHLLRTTTARAAFGAASANSANSATASEAAGHSGDASSGSASGANAGHGAGHSGGWDGPGGRRRSWRSSGQSPGSSGSSGHRRPVWKRVLWGFRRAAHAVWWAFRLLKLAVLLTLLGSITWVAYYLWAGCQRHSIVAPGSVLVWDMASMPIRESPQDGPSLSSWSGARHVTLLDVLLGLEEAKYDDRITGLILQMSGCSENPLASELKWAQIVELRNAVKEFRAAKRLRFGDSHVRLIAVTDSFPSQSLYFLASAFDEIIMEPHGRLPLHGGQLVRIFWKNTLDKLGVRLDGASIGSAKGLLSPFLHTSFPPSVRNNIQNVLGAMDAHIVEELLDDLKRRRARLPIGHPCRPPSHSPGEGLYGGVEGAPSASVGGDWRNRDCSLRRRWALSQRAGWFQCNSVNNAQYQTQEPEPPLLAPPSGATGFPVDPDMPSPIEHPFAHVDAGFQRTVAPLPLTAASLKR